MSEQRAVHFPKLETLATRFLAVASVLLFLLVALVVRSATTRTGVILLVE